METSKPAYPYKRPTLVQSLVPVVVLIILLALNVYFFGEDATYGSNQIALILAATVAALIGLKLGMPWKDMLDGMVATISSAMGAILILLMIGALAGTWMLSGIVPGMIYYGLQVMNPTIFLFAACVISAIVSLATGSSWTTIATVGLALLGIGNALGVSEAISAGAIISGAYFGDKMSPLSDTTNLAPAMAGTDLFTHIRYMTFTTVPSILITLIIFLALGFNYSSQGAVNIGEILNAIEGTFTINVWLFIVPVIVIFMIFKRVPALPALLAGVLLGALFAVMFQSHLLSRVSGIENAPIRSAYIAVMKSIYSSTSIATTNQMVSDLLLAKGMEGMLNTIWLIICAMIFGGLMEKSGMLKRIAGVLISFAHSTSSLIATTVGTCIFFNITASDQYLAIVVPGRMYYDIFKKRGLKPENLSRTLEDSGTVTSVLIPWNTCGAAQSSVLGVATLAYAPFCFFNIISPFMTIIFAYFNIKIRCIKQKHKAGIMSREFESVAN